MKKTLTQVINNMNEKALQDAYSIFKEGGFEGDINEFFNLIKTGVYIFDPILNTL